MLQQAHVSSELLISVAPDDYYAVRIATYLWVVGPSVLWNPQHCSCSKLLSGPTPGWSGHCHVGLGAAAVVGTVTPWRLSWGLPSDGPVTTMSWTATPSTPSPMSWPTATWLLGASDGLPAAFLLALLPGLCQIGFCFLQGQGELIHLRLLLVAVPDEQHKNLHHAGQHGQDLVRGWWHDGPHSLDVLGPRAPGVVRL